MVTATPDADMSVAAATQHETRAEVYDDGVVRLFAVMTVVWGIVGMLVGVVLAAQLARPALNFDVPYLSYGRLRPLHTNAVIFAFGGCALFSTSLYVVQRTCRATLFAPGLASFVFWGWQTVILAAAITLPLGITTSKEYAELEWPIDLLITVVWVAYAVVFFGTIMKRQDAAHLRRELVLRSVHRHRRGAPRRQQRRDPGDDVEVVQRSTVARSTRWCSGGTGTTRSASS